MLCAKKSTIVNSGNPVPKEENKTGEPQGFVEVVDDYIAQDKAITQYAKLTGAYAAEKQDFNLLIPPAEYVVKVAE
jgi:hypothetical protein